MPASFAQTVSQVGTGWLVFTLYMVLALLVFDILRLFHLRFKYSFYLSLFLTLSLLGYGNYNYQHPDTRVINMVINKPADTDGQSLKVVAISDIHLGYATNKTMLAGYVDMINAQRPDIVLIGGDLIDNSVAPLRYEHMEEELSKIYAPLGVYMVPGNHGVYQWHRGEREIHSADAHRTFKGFRGYLAQSDPTHRTGRPA